MRRTLLFSIITIICVGTLLGADPKSKTYSRCYGDLFRNSRICCLDHVDLSIDDGALVLYEKQGDGMVEITEDNRLYIDGELIRISREDRRLTQDYYDLTFEIIDEAKRIGFEGAKVGIQGARIGLIAVAGLFRLLSPDYDTDDLERDLEREADKIEEEAERLEIEAEDIEELAEDLEDVHVRLRRSVPELRRLGWF